MDSQQLQSFLAAFRAAGGWVHASFGLDNFADMGGGAKALKEIPPDTPLFHIPNKLLLTPYSSDLRTQLSDDEWEGLGSGWSRLILVMMWESSKGSSSPWSYYLESLPRTFDTPMFWNDEQLAELKGTDIEKRIGKEDAEREYEAKIKPIVDAHQDTFSSSHFFLENFHIHGSQILSRSFMVDASKITPEADVKANDDDSDDDEEEQIAVMVPMADMLNAAYERDNARLFDDEGDEEHAMPEGVEDGFTMVSTRTIQPSEQIFNTYASPPNSELLRKYGHVDVFPLGNHEEEGAWNFGNPGDEVELEGDLIVSSVNQGDTMARVDAWLEDQEDTFYLNFETELDESMIAFTRILLYDTEWERFAKKGKLPKPVVDDAVVEVLGKAIDKRLARYQHDMESDGKRLKADQWRDQHQKRATIVRYGEQRLLHRTKRLLRQAVEVPGQKRKADEEGDSGRKKWKQ